MNQCFKVNVVDCPVSFCLVADWRRVSPCPRWVGSVNTWCEALRNVSHDCTEELAISASWRLLHFLEKHNVTDTSMWRYLTFQTPSYITTTQTVMADLRFNLETKINIAPCEATPYCSGRVVCPCDPGSCVFWDEKPPARSFKAKWHQGVGKQRNWGTLLETGLERQLAGEYLLAQSEEGLDSVLSRVVPGEKHWAGVGILTIPQLSASMLEFSPMNEGCFHATADYSAFLDSLVESWKGCHAGIPRIVCLIWTWMIAPLW